MSRRLFIDVETLPPPEEARASVNPALVLELDGGRRALQPEAVAECTEEQFRRLALHAEYGRVLCVGMIVEQDGEIVCHGVLGRERQTMRFHLDEARTLR